MTVAAHEVLSGVVARSAAMQDILRVATRLAEARSPVLLRARADGQNSGPLVTQGPRRDGPSSRPMPSSPRALDRSCRNERGPHRRPVTPDGKTSGRGGPSSSTSEAEPALQGKLLACRGCRFERRVTRTAVDVRFVAASPDLRRAGRGTFREDLYPR